MQRRYFTTLSLSPIDNISIIFAAEKSFESSCYDSTYLIDVKGIPWTATKWEIIEFFKDLNILNGTDGIHFKLDSHYNNDAFIQLSAFTDYHTALQQKIRYIGNSAVKSTVLPIQFVFESKIFFKKKTTTKFTVKGANVDDFMNLVNNPAYPSDQRLLRLKELPLESTEKDIRRYFSGLSLFFFVEMLAFLN